MKKVLFVFLIYFIFVSKSYANYLPYYVNPNASYGHALAAVKSKTAVYDSNNDKANIIGILDGKKIRINSPVIPTESETYIASDFDKNIFLLSVYENQDEWMYVCYNQKKKLFGWIKKTEYVDYYTWQDFYNFFGRKYGLYLLRNVKEKDKKLYASPTYETNVADTFHFPRHISLWLITGDWMLVKITTYEGETKTGWLRWKLDDGSIIVFPNLK